MTTTPQKLELCVTIAAPPSRVWAALTTPDQMTRWMGEPEMALEIDTSWVVGTPFVVRGLLHHRFENRGTLVAFEPERLLGYTHLSSFSRLPDVPASHSSVEFALAPVPSGTTLTITVTGFPTESIFKHLEFYWRGTSVVLQRFVEQRAS